jgi:RimJ/RimL family protein N-acetyltransferase
LPGENEPAADSDPASTDAVELRDVTEDDLPVFYEQQRDPDALRMAAVAPRDRDAFRAHWTRLLADGTLTLRTVLVDGEVAGNVVSWVAGGERLVGYWIGKRFWGRGVATRALRQFLDQVRVRPLHAHVAKHNVGSIRVLEKCGFTVGVEESAALGVPADGIEELVMRLTGGGDDPP